MRVIGETSDGQALDIEPGEEIEIRLTENPTTGFKWTSVALGHPTCAVLDEGFRSPARPIPGAAGEHVWKVRGAERGSCDIAFHYARPWQSSSPERRFALHVNVR